jgi:hypothetical protein
MTILIAAFVGITSALLTIFLTPNLQHYFWMRQRQTERQLSLIDELNKVVARLVDLCSTDYDTAAAERRPPLFDPDEPALLELSVLRVQVVVLFSGPAIEAVEELVRRLVALGNSVPDTPLQQVANSIAQARVKALRALYQEIGIPTPSLGNFLRGHLTPPLQRLWVSMHEQSTRLLSRRREDQR